MVKQLSPSEWGARVDYDARPPDNVPNDKVIVHWNGPAKPTAYLGIEAEKAIMRGVETYHLSKGWLGAGYGFAIGMSGTIYRVRGYSASYAAHRGDLDNDGILENREAYPVYFMLGSGQVPTSKSLRALEALRLDFEIREGKELKLYGHQEVAQLGYGTSTACPGPNLMAYVSAHRYLVKDGDDVKLTVETAQVLKDAGMDIGDPAYYGLTTTPQSAHDNAINKAIEFLAKKQDDGLIPVPTGVKLTY